MSHPLVLGIDVGTSGVRCVAMDGAGRDIASAARRFADHDVDPRDPLGWAALVDRTVGDVLSHIDRDAVIGIAIDGTSGSVLAIDARGEPLGLPLMYNDAVEDASIVRRIAAIAPSDCAAHGPTSGLAKALVLQTTNGVARLLHQADWLAARLSGEWDIGDENNALKTGYDCIAGCWGGWIGDSGLRDGLLPRIVPAGTPIAPILPKVADRFGLSRHAMIVAGTTDGCASFLATGACEIGDGVTALGSSLTLKVLADRPISSPEHGIYSHRICGGWLAGGASNTGGRVLAAYFDRDRLAELSEHIDPDRAAQFDYYPLLAVGERFPFADPGLSPRLSPRPVNEADFLHELLAGIAAIEAEGYSRLTQLGAPSLRSVRSVGGGAANPNWTLMRQRLLGAPFLPAQSVEAASGAARLALQGVSAGVAA
jgi:sugar (pentulose or hexulose) kinase